MYSYRRSVAITVNARGESAMMWKIPNCMRLGGEWEGVLQQPSRYPHTVPRRGTSNHTYMQTHAWNAGTQGDTLHE